MEADLSSSAVDIAPAADGVASLWRRACALVVDLIVLSAANLLVQAVFGVTTVTGGSPTLGMYTTTSVVWWPWGWFSGLAYFIAFEWLFGATPGKGLLGLCVTNLAGQRASFRQVAMRDLLRVVDMLPGVYLVGGIAAGLSPLRQRLGDRLAGTIVVRQAALPAPLLPASVLLRRVSLTALVLLALGACTGVFWYFGRPPLVIQSMINTQAAMFQDGVSAYALSAPAWGNSMVTYQVTYQTQAPADTCHATIALTWTPLGGWVFAHGQASCLHHTP